MTVRTAATVVDLPKDPTTAKIARRTSAGLEGAFDTSSASGATFNTADFGTQTNPLSGGQSAGLAADLVVRIGGDKGSEVFNFRAGATITQVVNAINLVSDGTGRPRRCRVRPPCFYTVSAMPEILKGLSIPDIVPTFGMMNMIGGECDR